MLNACAKTVQKWCVSTGKKCVRLSTQTMQITYHTICMWVKAQVIPKLPSIIPTGFSTAKPTIFNLLNTHLYPSSTAPTIITTKEIY